MKIKVAYPQAYEDYLKIQVKQALDMFIKVIRQEKNNEEIPKKVLS